MPTAPKGKDIIERGALADRLSRDLAAAVDPILRRYIQNMQRFVRRRSQRVNARVGGLGRK